MTISFARMEAISAEMQTSRAENSVRSARQKMLAGWFSMG
ncbi:hypothetical protein PATSB16_19530 [Pandoraea thiooxydans]|nr:hypothetical protein PATSB16_19530 [Pandoraea thiooxydans]